MKHFAVRFIAVMGGLTLALIGYNLIISPNETIDRRDTSVTAWMLDASRRDIALPIGISGSNIVDSSYWSGFGDSEVIIQIKCDPVIVDKYRNRCMSEFSKVEEGESVPDRFRSVNYDLWYKHVIAPSVYYYILFSRSDGSSILIRRIKS